MRLFAFWFFLISSTHIWGQINMTKYKVTQDIPTHTTVAHTDYSKLLRIKADPDTTLPRFIESDIRLKSSIVDHKTLTGDIYVCEYYADSLLVGYIGYDGSQMKRELYYNASEDIILEKRYTNGKIL